MTARFATRANGIRSAEAAEDQVQELFATQDIPGTRQERECLHSASGPACTRGADRTWPSTLQRAATWSELSLVSGE